MDSANSASAVAFAFELDFTWVQSRNFLVPHSGAERAGCGRKLAGAASREDLLSPLREQGKEDTRKCSGVTLSVAKTKKQEANVNSSKVV
jgi:hypothetical protein